jgi:putative FmdB family regulatory protein
MPLYDYRCRSCDHVFETLVPANKAAAAATVLACPECGAEADRQLGTFSVKTGGRSQPEAEPFCGRCGENRPPCS